MISENKTLPVNEIFRIILQPALVFFQSRELTAPVFILIGELDYDFRWMLPMNTHDQKLYLLLKELCSLPSIILLVHDVNASRPGISTLQFKKHRLQTISSDSIAVTGQLKLQKGKQKSEHVHQCKSTRWE